MPATIPLTGPHALHTSGSDVAKTQAEAIVFIAERLAGIEWLLTELNRKAIKIESSMIAVAQVLPKLKP